MEYKFTNKEITIKNHNGSPLILPAKVKVYKDSKGKYTETIFGEHDFKEEDLGNE